MKPTSTTTTAVLAITSAVAVWGCGKDPSDPEPRTVPDSAGVREEPTVEIGVEDGAQNSPEGESVS